jgi:hypothetical protein
VSVKLSTEEYSDTDFVINTADTTFRLPIKVKLASGNAVVGNGVALGITDGATNAGIRYTTAGSYSMMTPATSAYGQPVGTANVSGGTSINTALGITTDPTKSGIETSSSGLKLYFYVGETIQDANVIVASNALTEIANLKSYAIGMPDYSARVTVAVGVKTKVTVDSIYLGSSGGGGGADSLVSVQLYDESDNLVIKQANRYQSTGNTSDASVSIFVPKGYSINVDYGRNIMYSMLCPLKGVK